MHDVLLWFGICNSGGDQEFLVNTLSKYEEAIFLAHSYTSIRLVFCENSTIKFFKIQKLSVRKFPKSENTDHERTCF